MVTDAVENVAPKAYRQSIQPAYQKQSYVTDDTDNHDFRFFPAGKGRWTIHVDNPSDQVVTVSIYGAPDATAVIGDADVLQIGGNITAPTTDGIYETINDPFPFYLVRCTSSVTGDSTTATIYAHFTAF